MPTEQNYWHNTRLPINDKQLLKLTNAKIHTGPIYNPTKHIKCLNEKGGAPLKQF